MNPHMRDEDRRVMVSLFDAFVSAFIVNQNSLLIDSLVSAKDQLLISPNNATVSTSNKVMPMMGITQFEKEMP